MTTTWNDRKIMGEMHEELVKNKLRLRGWEVGGLADALNNTQLRYALNSLEPVTPLRWMPEFVATRQSAGAVSAYLVDAKTSGAKNQDSPYCSVATSALRHHEVIALAFHIEVVYVFSDMGTATAPEFAARCWPGVPRQGHGSGEPFMLMERRDCIPFDERFGALPPE